MFGVANQLLAAIAFGIGTIVIIKSGKTKYAWVTFVPMVFMFTTTLMASWELIVLFNQKASQALSPKDAFTFRIDAFLVLLMAVLAITVLLDMTRRIYIIFDGNTKT